MFASLRRHCPGTEVLDPDYGASRLTRLEAMLCVLGEPANSRVLKSARAATCALGLTRRIRVPVNGGELVGTTHAGGLLLASKEALTADVAAPVLAALAEVPRLQVEARLGNVFDDLERRGCLSGALGDAERRASRQPAKRAWWKFWQYGNLLTTW